MLLTCPNFAGYFLLKQVTGQCSPMYSPIPRKTTCSITPDPAQNHALAFETHNL